MKHFRQDKRDMNQVQFWEHTYIRGHLREFRFCGELATRNFAPLPKNK